MFDQSQDIGINPGEELPSEFENRIVNSLLQSENFINDFQRVADNTDHEIHGLPTNTLMLLMEKIDNYLEQTIQSQQDTSQILKLILKLMDYQQYIYSFYSINHLLAIIEQSNSFKDYEYVMRILVKVISHPDLSQKLRNQIRDNFLRITYLSRYLYDHQNTFSSNQIDIGDLFSNENWIQSDGSKKLVFQQINQQLYSKTYEQIKQKTQQTEENPQIFTDTLEVIDDGQQSAFELAKQQFKNYYGPSPLLDAIKYKILITRGLHQNKNATVLQIVALNLLSNQLLFFLNRLQFIVFESYQYLNQLLVTVNFQHLLNTCLKLLIIETEESDFYFVVIETIKFIIKSHQLEQRYDEKFLFIINDILSSNQHSHLLSKQCIKNEQIASKLLHIFTQNNNGRGFQNGSNLIIGSSQALVKTLMIQNNQLPLQIGVLKSAIQLLGKLSLQSDNDYILDDLLKIIENFLSISNIQKPIDNGYLQINLEEADLILSCCLQTLNEHFKEEQRNNNQVQRERNTRKITETSIFQKLKQILSLEYKQTFEQTLLLLSNVINQVPNLIGRLIDSQLLTILNNLIQQYDFQQQPNNELIITIVEFYQNITLNEEGQNLFNQFSMLFVRKSLKYFLTQSYPQREHIAQFGINISIYLTVHLQQVSDIIIEVLIELYNNLKSKQQSLTNDNASIEYNEILNKIVILSRFIQTNMMMRIPEELANRFFQVLITFTEFPLFSHRDIIFDLVPINFQNATLIIEKLLESINQWETSLGYKLEDDCATLDEKYYNQDQFFKNKQLNKSFEQVSNHQRIEYLLNSLNNAINQSNQNLNQQIQQHANSMLEKCCALFNIQSKFAEENREVNFRQRINLKLLSTILRVIRFIRNSAEIQQPTIYKILEQLSLSLSTDNLNNLKSTCNLIVGLLRTNLERRKRLLLLLLPSDFMKNLKLGLKSFLKKIQQGGYDENETASRIKNLYVEIIISIFDTKRIEQNQMDYQLSIYQINEIEGFLQIFINLKNLPFIKDFYEFILNQARRLCNAINEQNFNQAFLGHEQGQQLVFEDPIFEIREDALQLGYQRQDINMALQNIEFLSLTNVIDWIEQNRQEINEQQLEQQINQIDQFTNLKEQIKESQTKLKQFLKQNIIHFHVFEQQVFQIIEENMLPSLLQCLKQAVHEQFQLQLNIEDYQSEITLPKNVNVQTISTILCYIQFSSKEIVNRWDILPELIKLIKFLSESTDDKKLIVISINKILQIILSLLNHDQNRQNAHDDDNILKGFIMILQSENYDDITAVMIIEILIKIFSLRRENIRKFLIQMKGLEYLFSLKGHNFIGYSRKLLKLAVMIIHDKSIVIAQIEAKIKRILYDEEYNKTIERINNESQNQRRNRLSNYPISHHPIQYDIPIPQVIQIASNHPSLLYLQQQTQCEELVKEVMSKLFDEGETIDNVKYLILKSGIQLDTLDCVCLNSFQKYSQSEHQMNQRNYKQKLQSHFYHTKESQILLEQMLQQIIRSYYEKEQKYLFKSSTLFEVLLILIRRYPLLIPKLISINCAQWFDVSHQKQLGQNNSGLSNKISFITLKTRLIKEFKLLQFELCLDNVLLFKTANNQIIPFSHLIRMKTLNELYSEIQKNVQTFNISEDADTLIRILQITSVAKMCYPNSHDQQGFNFTKLYMDAFKRFDLKTYYNYQKELICLTQIITLLNNVAIQLQFYKPKKLPIVMPVQGQNVNQIQFQKMIGQLFPIEINAQLIPNHIIQSFNPNLHFENWLSKPESYNDEANNFNIQFNQYQHLKVAQINEINLNFQTSQNQQIVSLLQIDMVEEQQEIENNQIQNNQYEIDQFLINDENDQMISEQNEQQEENIDNLGNNLINQNFNLMFNEIRNLDDIKFPYQFLEILVRFRGLQPQQTQQIRTDQINQNRIQNNFQQSQQNLPLREQLNNQFIQQEYPNNPLIQAMQMMPDQIFPQNIEQLIIQDGYVNREGQGIQQNQQNQQIQRTINFIYNQWNVDVAFIQQLFCLLFLDSESFVDFPINLFIQFMNNQNIKNKFIDLLILILLNKQSGQINLPTFIITRNGMIKNQDTIYQIVSLKVLYLLSKLQGSQIDQLIQNQNSLKNLISNILIFKDQHNELLLQIIRNITILMQHQQTQIQLDENSIKNLCIYSVECNNRNIKTYSEIIQNLSKNENVKTQFITFMKDIIYKITHEINIGFKNNLRFAEIFKTEKKLIVIIQLLKEILDVEDLNTIGEFVTIMKQQELILFWQNLIRMLKQISIQEFTILNNIISPYFECFFIVYSIINPNQEQATQSLRVQSMETYISQQQYDDYKTLFYEICENGQPFLKILMKDYLARNDAIFQLLIKENPQLLDFEIKKRKFYQALPQNNRNNRQWDPQQTTLLVDRQNILEDSFRELRRLTQEQLKQIIRIQYVNQRGQDEGGLYRDWFTQVSKEIANPVHHLFKPSEINHQYQPNPNSSKNPNHLEYFKFIGRFVGKALYDRQLIDIYFTRSFYKNMIGKKLKLEDLESVDQDLYKKFVQMDNENIDDWGLYFTYTIDNNGVYEDRELIEGGSNIQVTDDNKKLYIKAYCNQRMAREIEQQIKAFLEGFYEIIPKETLKLFDWTDLELLLCGEKYIDIQDMRQNTNYEGFNENDQVIKWLWELLESFDQNKRTKFLQYVTGSSRVPAGGFSKLENRGQQKRITISRKNTEPPYPFAHTCSFELDLPNYQSRSILLDKLELAINFGNDGFDTA